MACPLLGTLLVTAILGFLEASDGVSLLGGGSFPKVQLLDLFPKLLVNIPSVFSPLTTQNRPHPRSPWLGTPGKEN